jgi:hypothetical protein
MKKIKVEAFMKTDFSWYVPIKEVDLTEYKNIELLSKSYYGDLFYAYNDDKIEDGRLFRGRWNDGVK